MRGAGVAEGERGVGVGGAAWRMGSAGVADGGRGVGVGARTGGGVGSVRPTPHLASPLEGGRDELGKGSGGCLGGRWEVVWVPAYAGMTVGAQE